MAMFLAGIEEEMNGCIPAGAAVTARVREAFSRWGAEPIMLSCVMDKNHRMTVEARLLAAAGERVDKKTLSRMVGEAAGRSFAPATATAEGGFLDLVLNERNLYKGMVGGCQSSQREGTICGDTWRSFLTGDGRLHILLSDGMGCGGSASLDSAMAVGLMSRLVQAGADYNSALQMVNSALLVKSGEESLATLDVAVIDLHSGKTDLYKAGAAPTFVRRGKRAGSVESISSPAGILNGVSFEHSTLAIKEGDWLVLVSDGATAAGVDWICEEVERFEGENPNNLAAKLERMARLRRSDGRRDDITVICVRLEAESF
jgi:stage II sporulation protein E